MQGGGGEWDSSGVRGAVLRGFSGWWLIFSVLGMTGI